MHEPHRPNKYIAGAYINQTDVWVGDFELTSHELYEYVEHDVKTVEEYGMLINMIVAQQVYAMWWDEVRFS